MIAPGGHAFPRLHLGCRVSNGVSTAMIGVLLAVDRRDVRRISVEIGASNSELLAVLIDPFPEELGGRPIAPRAFRL